MNNPVKAAIQALSLSIVFPFALLTGFGRFPTWFQCFGQLFALVPGAVGDYFRVAFYTLTLARCSMNSRISFGSFFAHSSAAIGEGVYIGAYCILGGCQIGDRTQIASHVQVLSGRHQHRRNPEGHILGAKAKEFRRVTIGRDCWIGAAAIVMDDIGSGSTIGAGAIVTRPIPENVVAVGNPARPLQQKWKTATS